MSFLSRMFGSDQVVDAGIRTIDSVVFTDEEKSTAKQRFLQLYEPFKLAQRFLAIIFGMPYVLAWAATFICSFFMDVTSAMTLLNDPNGIAPVVKAIAVFYFGGGAAEGVVKAIMGSFGKKAAT